MGKKQQKRQQKTTRKHRHHPHDAALPYIEVSPNIEKKPDPYLPKVVVECEKRISRRHIKKIQTRLRFANPHDLRYLSCVRVVEPAALIMPSKQLTLGCYKPKWKHQEPEIWLSSGLFEFSGFRTLFIEWFALRRDRLFDTLFHELGHHNAYQNRLVSDYKHEAYAEKYLQAYRQAWQAQHRWRQSMRCLVDRLFTLISNRYTLFVYCFVVRKKNEFTLRFYQVQKEYVFRRISTEEYEAQMESMFESASQRRKQGKTSQRWQHPLSQDKYRKKFRLDEHEGDL